MPPASPTPLIVTPGETAFVGRAQELGTLEEGLTEARASRGSAWLLEGPAGIGKTRLVRQLQSRASPLGFEALWGYGLREMSTPFLLFEQIFRGRKVVREQDLPSPLPALVILEEAKPRRLFSAAASLSTEHPCLLISRERPAQLRTEHPTLSPNAVVRWLSRGESEEAVSPANLDHLGERISRQFEEHRGSVVGLSGFEYLVALNGFGPVLRLAQFLRDVAEQSGGHLLLSLNPATLEPREIALLEGEGAVVGRSGKAEEAPARPASPSEAMMRYLDLLEQDAGRGPALVVLDDLQWADPESLRTFQFLARNVRSLPVVLLATLRTDDAAGADESPSRALTEILDTMTREGSVHRVALRGISPAEGADLARGLFGAPLAAGPEEPAFHDLYERSEGNPFFLKELLVQWAERGLVLRDRDGVHLSTPAEARARDTTGRPMIPNSLRHLLSRHLELLRAPERDVLEWGALIGTEFDIAPIAGVHPHSRDDLEPILEGLESRYHLLESRSEGAESRWGFTHPLLWEVVREEMPRGAFRQRALALADWWAVHRAQEVDTVARLYHEAAEGHRGIPWVRRAVDSALEARAPELVERYHRWLHELHASVESHLHERVADSLTISAQMQERMGSSAEGVRILRRVLALQPEDEMRQEAEAWLVLALLPTAPNDALPLLEKLRTEVGAMAEVPVRLDAILALAETSLALGQGHPEDLAKAVDRILSKGDRVPVWIRVRALYYSGVSLSHQGRAAEARARLDEALALATPTGDPWLLGACSDLEAFLAGLRGDVGAMARATENTLRHVRVIGDVNVITREALFNLGLDHVLVGDLAAARENLAECRKLSERFRLPWGAYLLPNLEGEIALREQHWPEAVTLLERAREGMERQGDSELGDSVTLALAEARLGAGEPDPALAELERMRLGEDREVSEDLWILYHLELAWYRWAKKEIGAARASTAEALRRAEASGNLFGRALARQYQSRWEEGTGNHARATELSGEAKRLFDEAGVRPDGWARSWPPSSVTLPSVPPTA